MTGLYGVIGRPVLHSLSPQMHNAAFGELGIDARYIRMAAESAEGALETCREVGVRGINVTAPFKGMVEIVDEADAAAMRIGAANTVLLKEGRTVAYNTDVDGVVGPLLARGIALSGRKALVLGAGGAARAAVVALQERGAKVTVANRTVDKARAVAKGLGVESCPLTGDGTARALDGCGIVVGCLSTGERVLPRDLLRKGMVVMDAHYSSESALLVDARAAGAEAIDGREWLLHQGMRAFELFTGKKAPEGAMRKALNAAMPGPGANIALVGFMGSGKDSVARALAAKSGWSVHDTDGEIEKKAGMPIARIFGERGELEFRRMEREELAGLGTRKREIINCGGGAAMDAANRESLRRSALSVWLWANPQETMRRVGGKKTRPLLDVPDPEARVRELLAARMESYAAASDMMIDTRGRSPGEIAERILHEAHSAFPDIWKA